MIINIFKKGVKKLNSGTDTWVVQWNKILNDYGYGKAKECYQAFIDKQEAEEFAESIRRANKLIGNTYGTTVTVTKQKSGLPNETD